tara:strand:+ start:374 stop:706 length:333 start_codon:yes stop_codon:yes gene_type:complete
MEFDEYQLQARVFADYPKIDEENIVYAALGLAGEAGELSNKVKKIFRDDGGHLRNGRREAIKHELGDILWYVAELCSVLELKMNDVAFMNLSMLLARTERDEIHGDGDNR